MNEQEIAYIAGLFDGEGSIVLAKDTRLTPGAFQLTISITNTNLKVLEWIQKLLVRGVTDSVSIEDYYGWSLTSGG